MARGLVVAVPSPVTELVRRSCVERLGEPTLTETFATGRLAVDVAKWSRSAATGDVTLYVTLGASARPLARRDVLHRVEFFVGLCPEDDRIMGPLAALAVYPTDEQVALDHGHTVPTGGAIWAGSEMNRMLILRQRESFLPTLAGPANLHVEFLQVIPLYEPEFDYKLQHGAEALLDLWERSGVPFWDPTRRPVPARRSTIDRASPRSRRALEPN